MPIVGDALDALYLGVFVFGLVFSAVSNLVGAVHVGGAGGHVANPHPSHGASAGHGGHRGGSVGPFNPLSLLAFVSWFGRAGYQARRALGLVTPASLVCGLIGGSTGTAIVWLFLARIVVPADRTLDPEDFRPEGLPARVSSGVRPNGTGEIGDEQGGVRVVSAARATDGGGLAPGSEVVILGVERGVALVRGRDGGAPP